MANIDISKLKKFINRNSFMLHSADDKLSVTHIDFWIDVISKAQIDFSILVRDENSFKKLIKQYPNMQICYAKNPIDVENVVNAQPDLKVVLYTTNLAKNIHLLRFNHLKHIFIGTKNSEWLSQFNKSYRAYDEIWCGGEFVINRIKEAIGNIGHLEFKIVGKPQLKETFQNFSTQNKSSLVLIDTNNGLLLEKIYYANNLLKNKIYLYLPKEKNTLKNELLNVAKSQGYANNIKIFDNKELVDEFVNKTSYIITDLKNLNPYLLSYNLPLIVYTEKEIDKYLIEPNILQDALYYFNTKDELLDILSSLNNNEDIIKEEREKTTNYIFNQEAILNDNFIRNINKENIEK